MARPASTAKLTLSQLENLLSDRRAEISRLERKRSKVARELKQLDLRITGLGGALRGGRNGSGRVRNEKSLNAMLEQVLGRSSKPMRVGDIADAVRSAGYRTKSVNFRGIVNQTLIKDKRFGSAGGGLYQIKK